jgi:hypothetical protein
MSFVTRASEKRLRFPGWWPPGGAKTVEFWSRESCFPNVFQNSNCLTCRLCADRRGDRTTTIAPSRPSPGTGRELRGSY